MARRPHAAVFEAILAPSDLPRAGTRRLASPQVKVGGRVLTKIGPRELLLADALGQIRVKLASPAAAGVEPGALLQLAGRWTGQCLTQAKIERHLPAPNSSGIGEFARLSWQSVGSRLVQRALAHACIRDYFASQAFLEVSTPVRVGTPGLDANVQALPAPPGWLSTSPEHHMKRLLVGGLPRIFQITPCFRAEEAGQLHEAEFTMLEWYRAFSDQREVMQDTEQLVYRVVLSLAGAAEILVGRQRVNVTPPFARLSVSAAFKRYAGVEDALSLAERDEKRYFELMVGSVEPALARRKRPIFLTDYPIGQAALARRSPKNPRAAERFELYLGGVELCNGFSELTDTAEQRRRFTQEQRARRSAGQPVYPLDERFLAALAEGMPPAGGNALGLDRLVMLAVGAESIAEVLAFPQASL